MDATTLQMLSLVTAFWVAVLGFATRTPEPRWGVRFVLGLGLAGWLAHVGWAFLNLPAVLEHPWAFLDPSTGYTVLAVPLGLLATVPWAEPSAGRRAYRAASLGSLPFALAVAKLGCLAAACCHGAPTSLPWGITLHGLPPLRHPTPLYEIGGFVALGFVTRRLPREWVAPAVLAGIGAIRIAVEPWRADPPLGPPLVPSSAIAALWVVAGAFLCPAATSARQRLLGTRRLA